MSLRHIACVLMTILVAIGHVFGERQVAELGRGDAVAACSTAADCRPCSQICSGGKCVPSGKSLCGNGACVPDTRREECNCTPSCAACVERCVRQEGGAWGCKKQEKELCAGSGECADIGYCSNDCGGRACRPCIERCDDGENGSKVCVPSGMIFCSPGGACVEQINRVNCNSEFTPKCKNRCDACTEICTYRNNSYVCDSSGNIRCASGACVPDNFICPAGAIGKLATQSEQGVGSSKFQALVKEQGAEESGEARW